MKSSINVVLLAFFLCIRVSTAQAADQLGCTTLGECFAECCPTNDISCSQTCRNSCGQTASSSCPGFYYFCKTNTNVSDWNWLELVSLSGRSLTGNFQYFNGRGTAISERVPFQLSPLQRSDFDAHSVVGRGTIGQAIVSLDGDADDISAAVSYYEVHGSTATQTVSLPCEKRQRAVQ